MNFFRQVKLARDKRVTVANLLDELVRRKRDCEVSVLRTGPFRLRELHASVANMDAFLRVKVGLKPGEPVAILRTNDTLCFHWFLAVIRAGGVAVPLNPMLSLTEVKRILETSGTRVLVTDRATFERTIKTREALDVRTWIDSGEDAEVLDGFLREEPMNDRFAPSEIDPAATIGVFHTSGTSGFPKGAALSSRALLGARSSTVISSLVLGQRDLALIALPWSHIMAVSIALYGLMAGIRGCFLEKFDTEGALEMIERNKVTAVVGVPAMFTRLVNAEPVPERLKSVKLWLSASDHLPSEIREKLRQYGALARLPFNLRMPPILVNGYGMVELGGLAMMGVELGFAPGSGEWCFPVPPFKIRVVDEEGRVVKAGREGECQIWRRGLKPHYWNDKGDAEGLLSKDGWLRTGDLAVRNRLGRVRLVGRAKDVIKSGGYSVYARELEEAVMTHPAVARAAVFGLPHKEKGEIPAAAVELHKNAGASERDLLEWCRERLAPYKAPRRIWIVEPGGLPQNSNGKLLRRELKARFAHMGD
jgi:acyl-CoA synthetase (AMP-forming)/AMP-acid ligase II